MTGYFLLTVLPAVFHHNSSWITTEDDLHSRIFLISDLSLIFQVLYCKRIHTVEYCGIFFCNITLLWWCHFPHGSFHEDAGSLRKTFRWSLFGKKNTEIDQYYYKDNKTYKDMLQIENAEKRPAIYPIILNKSIRPWEKIFLYKSIPSFRHSVVC